jgi:glycosyltransferase involved in cell wall biosynthesis
MKFKTMVNRGIQAFKKIIRQVLRKILPRPVRDLILKIIKYGEREIIAKNQVKLNELLQQYVPGKDYRTIIVFPPSLDWDVQLFQRPQQLALALAKQGALVFYTQPKPDRKKEPFQLIKKGLYLCNVHVDTFRVITNPIIYLLTWNSDYASRFKNPQIIYDFVDDINVFYGDQQQIAKGHQYLLKNSAYVLATAQKLVEEATTYRSDVIYSPNGVVYEHFAASPPQSPPDDLLPILNQSQPIIGYYGALARWFDYDLLKSVAALRPNYQFVLIGPDYDGTLEPAKISNLKNIYWLGVKPYADLPSYLHYFDVATIPFMVNDITNATSPLKLFEYIAGGKPVVVTPMRESMQYKDILIAKTPEEFANSLDKAILQGQDAAYISKIKEVARQNTWESRAEEVLQEIEKKSLSH